MAMEWMRKGYARLKAAWGWIVWLWLFTRLRRANRSALVRGERGR